MQSLESEVNKIHGVEASSQELPEWQTSDSVQLYKPHNHAISSKSYYDDQREVFGSESVDPYALPPKHVADVLYDHYIEFVDVSFPIIRKSLFTQQYQKFFADENARPGNKWLAILNMILAISSKYCSLAGQEVPGSFEANVFFQRTRALSANEDILYRHADLQQVQIEALIAFYFLISAQINRWASNFALATWNVTRNELAADY